MTGYLRVMRSLLSLLLLSTATPALAAQRVLVLPLDGDTPALGEALSTWLSEDLARAPALESPTRAEVEAAIPTGASAPLSLDLDYAIEGSWTRTASELTLVVQVGATQARATGAPADFVVIEQQLLAQILAAIGVEGTPGPPPSERLEAVEKWGEGLALRRAGSPEPAMQAFRQALALDPEFQRAQAELSTDAPAARTTHTMTTAQDAILAKFAPTTTVPDQGALVGFALRMMALENEGRHCDRAAEMEQFLELVDFEVALPRKLTEAAFATAVATEARALGFSAVPRSVRDLPPSAYVMPQRRVAGQFATTADFIFREASARNVAGSGLYGAIAQCDPPAQQQTRVIALSKSVYARMLADQLQQGRPAPGWTVRESFELAWASIQAQHLGPSPELERRLDALTSARDPSDPVLQQLLDRAADLRATASASAIPTPSHTADTDIVALLRGAADGAENVVHTAPFACSHALDSTRGTLYAWSSQLGTSSMEDGATRSEHMKQGAGYVAMLSELGCLVDTAASHADATAVQTSVTRRLNALPPGALSHADCGARVAALRADLETSSATEQSAVSWLMQLHDLGAVGCTP